MTRRASRQRYIDETWRTIPLLEGKTIRDTFTTGSFDPDLSREVFGLRVVFTDGTEITINSDSPIDIARGNGLYRREVL